MISFFRVHEKRLLSKSAPQVEVSAHTLTNQIRALERDFADRFRTESVTCQLNRALACGCSPIEVRALTRLQHNSE